MCMCECACTCMYMCAYVSVRVCVRACACVNVLVHCACACACRWIMGLGILWHSIGFFMSLDMSSSSQEKEMRLWICNGVLELQQGCCLAQMPVYFWIVTWLFWLLNCGSEVEPWSLLWNGGTGAHTNHHWGIIPHVLWTLSSPLSLITSFVLASQCARHLLFRSEVFRSLYSCMFHLKLR